MKRLAMATVVALTALRRRGARPGRRPSPSSSSTRVRVYHYTHYVRGAEEGKEHGGSESTHGRGPRRRRRAEAVAEAHARSRPAPTEARA